MSVNENTGTCFYGWINLAVCALIGIVAGFYIITFSYFLPFLIEDFGWDRGVVSLAATINLFALGLSGPVAGAFILRYGAKKAIFFGNILGAAGFLVLYFHTQLWQLFLGWGLLVGAGGGFGGLLANTTIVNNWFVKKRHLALSIYLSSGGAAGLVMGPSIMAMIGRFGWRTSSLVISAIVLVFAVILPTFLIRNKPQDLGQLPDGRPIPEKKTSKGVSHRTGYRTPVEFTAREATRTRCLWLLISYFCLTMLAMNALMTHQIAYLFDIGISSAMAATAMGVMSGFMAFGQLSVGFMGARYSMLSIAVGGEILKMSGMVILLSGGALSSVFVYMVVLGLGFGMSMAATMNIFPNYFGTSHYPRIMGSVRLFWTFIGGIGAPVAGMMREQDGSYLPAFEIALAVIAAGFICLVFTRPPVHPSLKESGDRSRKTGDGKSEKSVAWARP